MTNDDSHEALDVALRSLPEIQAPSDRAELLGRLATALVTSNRKAEASRALAEADTLLRLGVDSRAAVVVEAARAAMGDASGARVALAWLAKTVARQPSDIGKFAIPGGDVLRQNRPLAETRRLLEGHTNFAPRRETQLEEIAVAQGRLANAEGVWTTVATMESGYSKGRALEELTLGLHRHGKHRDALATLEIARPILCTRQDDRSRDFDLERIATIQARIGEPGAAMASVAAMRSSDRLRYRLGVLLAVGTHRFSQRDLTGAASVAERVNAEAPTLRKTDDAMARLAWPIPDLRLRAATILHKANRRELARAIWKELGPRIADDRRIALSRELASVGLLVEAQEHWAALERKGVPNQQFPIALAKARFLGASPTPRVDAELAASMGRVRDVQSLALTCADEAFYREAERVARTIDSQEERTETLRQIALHALSSHSTTG